MSQVVYVDVLLALNLILNYLLLLSGACLLRQSVRRWRLLAGACLGAIYSLVIFLPELPAPASVLLKALFCITIVLAAYPVRGFRHFVRLTACFLTANFVFAGAMMALWLLLRPKGMVYQNGAVYFNISVPVLILTAAVCYGLLTLFARILRRRAPENRIYSLQIELGGKALRTRALLDTGNSLSDCFSDTPVILLEYACAQQLLPPSLKELFKRRPSELLAPSEAAAAGFRLIPYHSVGGTGLLPAFRPDRVIISDGQTQTETRDVLVAVVRERLSSGEFSALLNISLIQGGKPDGICHSNRVT